MSLTEDDIARKESKRDNGKLQLSAFGINFTATGAIARRSLPFLTFLVLAMLGVYIVQGRVIQRIEAMDAHVGKLDGKLDTLTDQLKKKHLIASMPKRTMTAALGVHP